MPCTWTALDWPKTDKVFVVVDHRRVLPAFVEQAVGIKAVLALQAASPG